MRNLKPPSAPHNHVAAGLAGPDRVPLALRPGPAPAALTEAVLIVLGLLQAEVRVRHRDARSPGCPNLTLTEIQPVEGAKKVKYLYGLSLTTNDYPGYTDVTFDLYRPRGEPPFQVDDYMPLSVIDGDDLTRADYPDGDDVAWGAEEYLRDAIRELYTREEALALVEFFTEAYSHTKIGLHRIDPREWDSSRVGLGVIPSGGGPNHYMFDDPAHEDQPPVPVWGHFDLRFAKPCDDDPEPDVADIFTEPNISAKARDNVIPMPARCPF